MLNSKNDSYKMEWAFLVEEAYRDYNHNVGDNYDYPQYSIYLLIKTFFKFLWTTITWKCYKKN